MTSISEITPGRLREDIEQAISSRRNPPLLAFRRRTKIVATIGPATQSPERLRNLIEAGVNVMRLNFSHGTHDEHERVIQTARGIARDLKRPLAILQDLQGPRLRVGMMAGGAAMLTAGQNFVLTTRPIEGTRDAASVTYALLPREVRVGQRILLDDGHIRLRVIRIKGTDVYCLVEIGGELRDHKGMNIPGARLGVSPITDKDRADLEFGVNHGVDYVALSFVRGPDDAKALRAELTRLRARIPIIAKIEKAEAVDAIDEIVRAFDGVMVARGDLGVEIGPERVPLLQKAIIRKANEAYRVVITATQMLESMIHSATPTRAEASDVANAILDGTDAVMLSAETSVGSYPIEAVAMMDRIAKQADTVEVPHSLPKATYPAQAVIRAAHGLAQEVGARAICVTTISGRTAFLMAKHRPQEPVFGFTLSEQVYNRLSLWWGITPVLAPFAKQTMQMIDHVEESMLQMSIARPGEEILVVGSMPLTGAGKANFMKLHTIRRRTSKRLIADFQAHRLERNQPE